MKTSMLAGLIALSMSMTPVMADDHNTIKTHTIKDSIHVISGDGGNITVVEDERGLLVIDSGLKPYSEDLLMSISDIADSPIRFLVNTHWHFDHVGANLGINETGTTILAHHNVHSRMQQGGNIAAFGREVAPATANELPVITYDNGIKFHWSNDILDVQHFPKGHTDGDSIVFFENANVVIMGDILFHGIYPFIDASSGGSMVGVINAVNHVISNIDDNTVVIPGHGGVTTDKTGLIAYRDMLETVYSTMLAMKNEGMSVEEIVAAKPTAQFDSEWNDGFIKADTWVKIIYDAM